MSYYDSMASVNIYMGKIVRIRLSIELINSIIKICHFHTSKTNSNLVGNKKKSSFTKWKRNSLEVITGNFWIGPYVQ